MANKLCFFLLTNEGREVLDKIFAQISHNIDIGYYGWIASIYSGKVPIEKDGDTFSSLVNSTMQRPARWSMLFEKVRDNLPDEEAKSSIDEQIKKLKEYIDSQINQLSEGLDACNNSFSPISEKVKKTIYDARKLEVRIKMPSFLKGGCENVISSFKGDPFFKLTKEKGDLSIKIKSTGSFLKKIKNKVRKDKQGENRNPELVYLQFQIHRLFSFLKKNQIPTEKFTIINKSESQEGKSDMANLKHIGEHANRRIDESKRLELDKISSHNDLKVVRNKNKELSKDLNKKQMEVVGFKKEEKRLKNEVADLNKNIEKLNNKAEKYGPIILSQNKKIGEVQGELKNQQEITNNQKNEISELKKRVGEDAKEILGLKDELHKTTIALDNAKNKLNKKQGLLEKTQQELKEKREEVKKQGNKIVRLNEKSVEDAGQISDLKERLIKTEVELDKAKKELEETQSLFKKAQKEWQGKIEKIKSQKIKLDKLMAEVQESKDENPAQEKKQEEHQAKIKELNGELENKNREIFLLNQELDSQKRNNAKLDGLLPKKPELQRYSRNEGKEAKNELPVENKNVEKPELNFMLQFAMQHPYIMAGAIGLTVAAAIVLTVFTWGAAAGIAASVGSGISSVFTSATLPTAATTAIGTSTVAIGSWGATAGASAYFFNRKANALHKAARGKSDSGCQRMDGPE